MEIKDNKVVEHKAVSQTIDFYKIFKVFLSRWYWILGCVIVAMLIAKINLLYTVPYYQTSGQLRLKETNPMLSSTSSAAASQVYNYTDKIQAESFVIKSQAVVSKAVKALNYKIAYYYDLRWGRFEAYPNIPFKINIIKQDSVNFNTGEYQIQPINARTFSLKTPEDAKGKSTIYRYGQPIHAGQMIFSINSKVPQIYYFKFNSEAELIGRITSGLSATEAARFTNVMSVSQTDQNSAFAADALNAVMKEYVTNDIIDKQKSANQMVAYIKKQLDYITDQVDSSGSDLRNYKIKNNIVDIRSATTEISANLADAQSRKKIAVMENVGISLLLDQLNNNTEKLVPNNNISGPTSGTLLASITTFNSLIDSRENNIKTYGSGSEPIQLLDAKIAATKESIRKSIYALAELNKKTQQIIDNEIEKYNQQLTTLPGKEQSFIKLESTYEVNNKVRTYLKERQLEAEMNTAAVVAGAEIVNMAYENTIPTGNDAQNTYIAALFFGFAVGIGLILLVRFINPYIYDKETVEALTRTPIIGVIRKFPEYIDKNNRQALSLSKPKSVFAESVRSVRTNLSFMASHKKSKTICITSEVSGEGKSFVTVNLAGTLALIDKKVILIAADLRKSKLHKAFGSNNKVGLSSYLSGQAELTDIIIHDEVHNIDFMPSGPVPPNPSELLHTDKMKELLAILTPRYDYVLVDTAPVGLVSDAIPLIRQSDVNLFVLRSGKSQFRAAAIPERLSREYGLSNLAIVLNAFGDDSLHANYYTTDYSRGGGNSTYYYSDYSGYAGSGYYDNDPKKWWEFWKKK
ncbi:polysaccharide biosynthesis tyrosine autokinase [Pedobacter sp. Du54]|uniref:polysaccharide biosynthesis tyrosine autokinase n=1 Tax=Pedobacter anseongensis TaxID=3133439 RepID=UPI0030A50265